ncbi:MAG: hypothetical protein Gaeavirus17_2 [Gaeavirus sp.]|uniref:Uncharacterized protein n=1 Tax=Gaeavirus sp. TaxID=2487767 RepID=A0A3G4ZZ36_9VIRU|nr:MAG: hypothetical protein Gaeavirus17_2 [Gaeavirus sp.]
MTTLSRRSTRCSSRRSIKHSIRGGAGSRGRPVGSKNSTTKNSTTKNSTTKKPASKKESKSKKTSKPKAAPKPKRVPKLKPYCGIANPIPKGFRIGSMKECLDAKKVSYYGVKKIDSRLIDSINKKLETRIDLQVKVSGLVGKLSNLKRKIESSKDTAERKTMITEFETTRKSVLELNERIQKLKAAEIK